MKRRHRIAVAQVAGIFLILAIIAALSVSHTECERVAGAHSRACTD